jgi:hypothetical protein
MFRSVPIDIRAKSQQQYPSSESSYSSSSGISSGLYVPVHKRMSGSSSASSSWSSGGRSPSPAYSARNSYPRAGHSEESIGKHQSPEVVRNRQLMPSRTAARPFVYSPADLILLSRSPLAKLSPEGRASLKDTVPEILSNRRQRKAAAYLSGSDDGQNAPNGGGGPGSGPQKPLPVRPSRAVGRVPNRRQLQPKAMDDAANWRGRRISTESMPVTVAV